MSIPFPINILLAANTVKRLSINPTDAAEGFILQSSSNNAAIVYIGRMKADGTLPAGPYDDTNANTMYTLNAGATVLIRPSRGAQLRGENFQLQELWGFSTAAARVIANPERRE